MIPLRDENPTFRSPATTILLLAVLAAVWALYQGAGLDAEALAASVCNLGLVPGELTHRAALGTAVAIGPGMLCIVDDAAVNLWTPLTSMFLHGGWLHLIGNGLFLWVFGKSIEDSMGRLRFLAFYLACGLVAAAAQVLFDPSSPVPMVGASGAISGVMGAYLVLYPRVRIRMLFIFIIFFRVFRVPAWIVLAYWFFVQVVAAFPSLSGAQQNVPAGVAVLAHIGGFLAGAVLAKVFANRELVEEHLRAPLMA